MIHTDPGGSIYIKVMPCRVNKVRDRYN